MARLAAPFAGSPVPGRVASGDRGSRASAERSRGSSHSRCFRNPCAYRGTSRLHRLGRFDGSACRRRGTQSAAGRRVSHSEHLEELHRHGGGEALPDGKVALDEPLRDQLDPELLERWRSLSALPATTPRQLLAHTSGIPNYFGEEAFFARVRTSRAAHGIRSSSSTMSRRAAPPSSFQAWVQLLGHWLRSRRDPYGAGHRPTAARGLSRARLRPAGMGTHGSRGTNPR